jgi:hypothetical protein
MRLSALSLVSLALWSCAKAGLVPAGTALERLDRHGLFNECIAQLAKRGIAVAPPPEVVTSEKHVGIAAYQTLSGRVVLPPPKRTAESVREDFLHTVSDVMTGGRWDWKPYGADDRTATLLHHFHVFGLVYQGVLQHLQATGVLKPGRVDENDRYDVERMGTKARVAFLRYYAERIEPSLRPLYDLYQRGIREIDERLSADLKKMVGLPEPEARRYWMERGKWFFEARSGQRMLGAFYVHWMVEDFARVDASSHFQDLAALKLK